MRTANVPAAGAIPNVDFALPPAGSLPRVLVFVDSDRDGAADDGEQRLSGISVSLLDRPCSQIGSLLETKPTLDDGTVIFAAPPARLAAAPVNGDALCAAVSGGLPNSLLPASAAGVNVPRTSGATALLPVQLAGAVVVSVFWDADGDLVQDSGEPGIGGGSVTLNGLTRILPAGGPTQAAFLLLPGSYALQVAAPYGYVPAVATPLTVVLNPNASQTVAIPLRAQSTISGLVTPPVGRYIGDVPVTLENVDTGQIWETIAVSNYSNNPWARHYAFHNLVERHLPPAPARAAAGLLAASEPLITLPANAAHTENLTLVPVGQVTGRVFVDLNGDGLRQSGESGTDYFARAGHWQRRRAAADRHARGRRQLQRRGTERQHALLSCASSSPTATGSPARRRGSLPLARRRWTCSLGRRISFRPARRRAASSGARSTGRMA